MSKPLRGGVSRDGTGGGSATGREGESGLPLLRTLHLKHPLSIPPYLPHDNYAATSIDADSIIAASEMQVSALAELLSMKFPGFLSHVMYDAQVMTFLDSFLSHRVRPTEAMLEKGLGLPGEPMTETPAQEARGKRLEQLVLFVYLRLYVGGEWKGVYGSSPEQELTYAKTLSDAKILDIPKVLDLCGLYGFTNPDLTSRLVEGAFRLDGGLIEELSKAGAPMKHVVDEIVARVNGAEDDDVQTMEDMLRYLGDLTSSLSRLLHGYHPARVVLGCEQPELFQGLAEVYTTSLDRILECLRQVGMEEGPLKRRCEWVRRCVVAMTWAVLDALGDRAMSERADDEPHTSFERLFDLVARLAGHDEGLPCGSLIGDLLRRHGLVKKLEDLRKSGKGSGDRSSVNYLLSLLQLPDDQRAQRHPKRSKPGSRVMNGHGAAKTDERVSSGGSKPSRSQVKEMIDEVKQILPDLGDAFVHACLAVMSYNTQATVHLLLEGGDLPYPLYLLDRSLGAPQGKTTQDTRRDDDEKDDEFIRLQKAYLRNLERDQDDQAFIMKQYDDEYDDQYDELGFAPDAASSNIDYESIRKYNTIVKAQEAEDDFWASMKNSNRPASDEDEEEEEEEGEGGAADISGDQGAAAAGGGGGPGTTTGAARAPERPRGEKDDGRRGGRGVRGGRGGRAEGGGGGRGAQGGRAGRGEESDLSRIQKRRKDQNKARVGNHNRAKLAQRKQMRAGGFPSDT